MLIRHISIPRNSHLIALKEPKQRQEREQAVDYSNHIMRTLNPEQPANDILVNHIKPQKIEKKPEVIKPLFQTFEKPQFLVQEYPLTIEQFTDSPISPQQTQQVKSKPPTKKSNAYRIKQSWQTLTPQLHNQAYMKSLPKHNSDYISQFQHVNNNFYLTHKEPNSFFLPKDSENQRDEGLVNHHSKMHAQNGEVYKTLQKFRHKNRLEEMHDAYPKQKKYNLSLPKQKLHHKEWYSTLSPGPAPAPAPSQTNEAPLEARKTRKKSGFKLLETRSPSANLPQQTKKRFMPKEEDEQLKNSPLNFGHQEPSRIARKASEQQSAIHEKPESELIHINKKLKKRHSAFDKFENIRISSSPRIQPVQISYRVSLNQLRDICSNPNIQASNIIMKIPEIFAYPLFTGNQDQTQLFSKASELVKHLQIKAKDDISIKKYTNCILIVNQGLAIIWHFSGKVYFGGWQYQVLDEGTKTGLGLEWSPNKYVYYGQFSKNKRDGVGIMKNSSNQIMAGLWRDNKFVRSLGLNVRLQALGQYDYN